ncbi:MAG: hypothetical protein U5L96_09780 [Owenweeksia sp.]|nr:hypothetical protein [Owenweeksia sp.]
MVVKIDTSGFQLFYTIENPEPGFIAVPDTICSGESILLQDSSSSGVNHEWFVNDSLFSTQPNPVLTLFNNSNSSDSLLTIKLRVTVAVSGCVDSISKNVVVHPGPEADFNIPARLCANDSVQAVNSSVPAANLKYQWYASSMAVNISDDTLAQPYFYFPDNQSGVDSTYQISLVVANAYGCVDSIQKSITINSRPLADFQLPANACGPLSFIPGGSFIWARPFV